MLKKYYNHVAHRDEDKKKDAGDKGRDDEFPPVENAFFIFGLHCLPAGHRTQP